MSNESPRESFLTPREVSPLVSLGKTLEQMNLSRCFQSVIKGLAPEKAEVLERIKRVVQDLRKHCEEQQRQRGYLHPVPAPKYDNLPPELRRLLVQVYKDAVAAWEVLDAIDKLLGAVAALHHTVRDSDIRINEKVQADPQAIAQIQQYQATIAQQRDAIAEAVADLRQRNLLP
ncbi:MAG: hypothetical protein KatS3mg099_427 [Candidatus Parcubacteria bacterium]|nr:MAG: hypothetical protein KatS3mg099_427 [Candidatus Parcubacteria bacterium]